MRYLLVLLLLAAAPTKVIADTTGALNGRVLDSLTQQPLANVEVRAVAPNADRTTHTNAHGDFVLLNLLPSTYRITFRCPGYAANGFAALEIPAGDEIHVQVTLRRQLRMVIDGFHSITRGWLVRPGFTADVYLLGAGIPTIGPPVSVFGSLPFIPGFTSTPPRSNGRFFTCALALVCLLASEARAVAGAPFDDRLVTGRFCSPAGIMSAITRALAKDNGKLGSFASSNLDFVTSLTSSGIAVALPDGNIANVPTTSAMRQICKYGPIEERVSFQNRTFPAQYVRAYADVLQYRQNQPWVYGAADMTAPDAQLTIERYPPNYIIVYLADYMRRVDSQGRVLMFTCAFSEEYRVSLDADQVLPFDRCVESHKHLLPSFGALPD